MTWLFLIHLLIFGLTKSWKIHIRPLKLLFMNSGKGFGSYDGIPKPKIITPSNGSTQNNIDKFLMMYTCKICNNRNANMVSKVAYHSGMVIATCKSCRNKHLIADNKKKLDFPDKFGTKIEDYLLSKGEKVQKLTVSPRDLEDNYLVDEDGVISLIPKIAGQVCYITFFNKIIF